MDTSRTNPDIALGDVAMDTITGFEGVAVAITQWLNGCDRITLQSQELRKGKPGEGVTFDALQLALVRKSGHAPKTETGGPRPEPTRNSVSR